MKIAFITSSLQVAGAERQLTALAKALHARGREVIVIALYPGGTMGNELRKAGIPVYVLDKRGRWDNLAFMYRLWKVLRQERCTVIHGYVCTPNIITVLLKPFLPSVRVVWGVRNADRALFTYDWFVFLCYRFEAALSRFADLIIANSSTGRDDAVKHGFPKSKVIVIPNGIDSDRFRPVPAEGLRLRNAWKIGPSEKVIGRVGRLDLMKDYPTFLRAAARVASKRVDVRFVCVGGGPVTSTAEIHALAEELGLSGRIIWISECKDMPEMYSAFDVLVSSSVTEGFPNVIGEAMACGVPCVATDVGDSAWIIGDTGIITERSNPEALASGILRALECLGPETGRRARARIEEMFNIGHLVERTEKALGIAARIDQRPLPAEIRGEPTEV